MLDEPMPPLELAPVDAVDITTVMENTYDALLASSDVARRLRRGPNPFEQPQPIAQHGFSVLISTTRDGARQRVLFDTGVSKDGFLRNLDVLEIRANELNAIVLSHGHADHALGLAGLWERLGERRVPLVLHPDAYLERKVVLPNGDETRIPPPRRSDLRRESVELIEEVGPSMLVDGAILVSGEVARVTPFEKGFPIHWARRDGQWQPDPLIHDDQCAIVHVRGKGLVIVTGCGHAGIVNIILNARRLTGVEKVHAVVGGFHLTGGLFDPIIPMTVAALQEIAPDYLAPGHCTGFAAMRQIANAMPDSFVFNCVGTTLMFGADAP
jgi:7,8-dihydropterin-6-yl-methyl-4-(beta-D-ribofuranosyl)aminobenzene 5'-phosphate synthase